jgi:hypothetical protein
MPLPEIFGTLPQWISAAGIGTLVWAFVWRHVGLKKIAAEADAGLRTHFGEELGRLSASVRECEADKRAMRKELNEVHDELTGLKRQMADYSADKLAILEQRGCPSEVAPHAVASIERVKKITEEKK